MTGPTDGPSADQPRQPLPPHLDPRRGRAGGPARPGADQPAAPTPPRRRRSRKRIAAWIAGSLAAVLLLGTITGVATLDHIISGIKKINPFCTDPCGRPGGGVKGDLNILIVGSDSRSGLTDAQKRQLHVGGDAGRRSDTMILLHIPRGGGKAILVSLPRDSYVLIPKHKDATGHVIPASHNKLNTAYAFGGPKLTVATVERNTGVRIDHYVEVNFLGFVKMVDALGGVTVCTPTAISDPIRRLPTGGYGGSGLELPKGKSKLNGVRALEYVRAREFDPSADLGRIQRQQKFMAAMVQKAKSAGILLNPVRVLDFVGAVADSLTTDKDFGTKQIKDLALNLRSMSPSHVEMIRVPLKPGSFNMGAIGNVVEWDPILSRQLFRDLTLDRPVGAGDQGKSRKVTVPPGSISVPVLNATNQNGLASKVASDLSALGFHASASFSKPSGADPKTTVIAYGPSRSDSAKTLAAAIPGAKLREVSSLGSSIQVIVGSNYNGVQRVVVVAAGQTGTVTQPRTAADDICS
ncbi:MAG TPA: LCP family protein [Mycobacteriales bacterium]|jgi:LCP family protein required for cell wall assembly|nr:LCP family protein [Mycobacteriales bacterium]